MTLLNGQTPTIRRQGTFGPMSEHIDRELEDAPWGHLLLLSPQVFFATHHLSREKVEPILIFDRSGKRFFATVSRPPCSGWACPV